MSVAASGWASPARLSGSCPSNRRHSPLGFRAGFGQTIRADVRHLALFWGAVQSARFDLHYGGIIHRSAGVVKYLLDHRHVSGLHASLATNQPVKLGVIPTDYSGKHGDDAQRPNFGEETFCHTYHHLLYPTDRIAITATNLLPVIRAFWVWPMLWRLLCRRRSCRFRRIGVDRILGVIEGLIRGREQMKNRRFQGPSVANSSRSPRLNSPDQPARRL